MATVLGTVYLNGCNYQLAYDLLGQNSASNQSNVRLYGILNVTNNYISWSRGSASVHTSGLQGIGTYYSKGSHTLITRDFTFTHDNNGNFSAYIGASLSTTFVSGDTGGTLTLPQIKRYPVISSAPNWNDDENPTMTFTNYGLFPVRVKIEAGGNTQLITRDISQTATNYTFELTDEERKTLRTLSKNSKTLSTIFTVCAMSGNTELSASYLSRTMTMINAEPTFTYTFEETNEKVINLLGQDNNLIIQNVSQPKITVTPTAHKEATISSVDFTHNGIVTNDTTSPYEVITTAKNGTFDILVTDSRKLTAGETITKDLIQYQPVKINSYEFKRENPTSSNIYINLDSVYYQTKFNETDNVPLVQWRLNEGIYNLYPSNDLYPSEDLYSENSWVTIPSEYYEIDKENNKLIIRNYKIEDILPYKEKGQFYIRISDLFTNATDNMLVIRGIPIMDWGEHDVQVNGDLFIADENRQNKVNVLEKLNLLKSYVLYENPDGNKGNIPLSDNPLNYEKLEFVVGNDSYNQVVTIYPKVNFSSVGLSYFFHDDKIAMGHFSSWYTPNVNTLTYDYSIRFYKYINNTNAIIDNNNSVKVFKVVGYKQLA